MFQSSIRFQKGFTIVELLIVIVVIGILAAITVVAYNGVRGRANDTSIQSDMQGLGKVVSMAYITDSFHPVTDDDLATLNLRVSKASYGKHLIDTGSGYKYNLLYCATEPGYSPVRFAFIASSTSNKVFGFYGGSVKEYSRSSWNEGWGTICPLILETGSGDVADGVWLYQNSTWNDWVLNK